jgi:cytidine deaminase
MTPIDRERLIEAARVAEENAYCPYSRYAVGAAVLTGDGLIFASCNVENASLSLSLCAERAAVSAAVSAGYYDIVAMAIFHEGEHPPYPCGSCRQVLFEFNRDMTIIVVSDGTEEEFLLSELLPSPFVITDD